MTCHGDGLTRCLCEGDHCACPNEGETSCEGCGECEEFWREDREEPPAFHAGGVVTDGRPVWLCNASRLPQSAVIALGRRSLGQTTTQMLVRYTSGVRLLRGLEPECRGTGLSPECGGCRCPSCLRREG